MGNSEETEQERTWDRLYREILDVLSRFGTEDPFGGADYLLVDDNYGWRQHTIEIHKLRMLDPALVKLLRPLLYELKDWEIVVAVDVPGTEYTWPRMGLIIRKNEIIDGLQRKYLPAEFQKIEFEGSRPGTGYD